MVQFYKFLKLSKNLFDDLDSKKIRNLKINKDKKYKNISIWDLRLKSLIHCYHQIFPDYYKDLKSNIKINNDTLLDFDTQTINYDGDQIIVCDSKNEGYIFSYDEIVQIFTNNLSNSVAVLNNLFNIKDCSVIKTFKIPINPWTNAEFTLSEIEQIVGQMILIISFRDYKLNSNQILSYFILYFPIIYDKINTIKKSIKNIDEYNRNVNQILLDFFNNYGFQFKEKTIIKSNDCINESNWTKKIGKILYILENILF